jgi:ribosomal protein S12
VKNLTLGGILNTIRQMAEERRNRTQTPPTRAGEHRGKCVGVYELNRTSKVRTVARVLLASGFVVTAYLGVAAAVPEVGSDVVVAASLSGDEGDGRGFIVTGDPGTEDLPPARFLITE